MSMRAVASTVSILALSACGGSPPPPPPAPVAAASSLPPADSAAPRNSGDVPVASLAPSSEAKPEPPPPPDVTFAAVENAPAPAKMPKVAIKAPTKGQIVPTAKAADFQVKLDVRDWPASDGDDICLSLDGGPCGYVRDPKKPARLGNVATGDIAEGPHVLAAYPRRAGTHESVKGTGKGAPIAIVPFFVGKKTKPMWEEGAPLLLFSTPEFKDGSILVDYVVANVDLGEGHAVLHAMASGPGLGGGKGESIARYTPWRIEHARPGLYTIRLVLLRYEADKMDSTSSTSVRYVAKEIGGPLSDVTRTVRVPP